MTYEEAVGHISGVTAVRRPIPVASEANRYSSDVTVVRRPNPLCAEGEQVTAPG